MHLDEFIAQLQVLRSQYGDLPVWVRDGVPPSPRATVQEMIPPNPHDPPEKIVFIE